MRVLLRLLVHAVAARQAQHGEGGRLVPVACPPRPNTTSRRTQRAGPNTRTIWPRGAAGGGGSVSITSVGRGSHCRRKSREPQLSRSRSDLKTEFSRVIFCGVIGVVCFPPTASGTDALMASMPAATHPRNAQTPSSTADVVFSARHVAKPFCSCSLIHMRICACAKCCQNAKTWQRDLPSRRPTPARLRGWSGDTEPGLVDV